MDIIVCIKQVPETNEVEIDPEKGILKREGVDSKLNPFDLHALEAALSLKEQYGGKVTVVSMGPPQAQAVIYEALAMGADDGVLLSDRRFAGADTLATSYTLSRAIRRLRPFDLVICGMQTTDGDTAQVGPGIAEFLGIPHVSYVLKVHKATESGLEIEMDMTDARERLVVRLPCLLTIAKEANRPRLPSLRRRLATREREIPVWGADDLKGGEVDYFGLDGSPTQVEKVFPPEEETEHEIWDGDPDRLAGKLYDKLQELRLI